jgi:hypothetical protein
MRALQENFPGSARLTSSIYSVTRLLGVHILRKVPASVPVTLTYNNFAIDPTVMIPRYSQFNINGIPYFNRDTIVINTVSPTANVTLYQGMVNIFAATSSGMPFQRFEVGNADFGCSDQDVVVFDDSYNQYNPFSDGIWNAPSSAKVFFENTTPNGNVELQFGNGIYGAQPALNKTLNIIYVITLGSSGNNSVSGLNVSLTNLNSVVPDAIRSSIQGNAAALTNRIVAGVTGTTTDISDNGADENDQDFYRVLSPHLYSSFGRTVTGPDYNTVPLTYSGLIDVYVQGQRTLGRTNRNLINVVGITPLKSDGTPMSDTEFNAFTAWLDVRAIGKAEYLHIRPNPVVENVVANVFCAQNTDLIKTMSFIQYQMAANFGVRRGSLGYSVFLSDIEATCRVRQFDMQVDYLTLLQPTNDCVVGPTDFVSLTPPQLTMGYSNRTFVSQVGSGPGSSLPT